MRENGCSAVGDVGLAGAVMRGPWQRLEAVGSEKQPTVSVTGPDPGWFAASAGATAHRLPTRAMGEQGEP